VIPRAHIVAWRQVAPWVSDALVEQDLIMSRALVAIFENSVLAAALAFRGGTALHKLYLQPARRYSEDVDLVQVTPGPIGSILDTLKGVLNPFLGEPPWLNRGGGRRKKPINVFRLFFFPSLSKIPARKWSLFR